MKKKSLSHIFEAHIAPNRRNNPKARTVYKSLMRNYSIVHQNGRRSIVLASDYHRYVSLGLLIPIDKKVALVPLGFRALVEDRRLHVDAQGMKTSWDLIKKYFLRHRPPSGWSVDRRMKEGKPRVPSLTMSFEVLRGTKKKPIIEIHYFKTAEIW